MAFKDKKGGRSATVLTALACEHLSENGQMVVFVPPGSLFANSGGEQILREGWIKNGELTAVVFLPKDAFQPYSQVNTHALLIEKTRQPNYINWFFQPRFDGFTSGRNRQPDPEHNDLPMVTAAIRSRKETRAFDRSRLPAITATGQFRRQNVELAANPGRHSQPGRRHLRRPPFRARLCVSQRGRFLLRRQGFSRLAKGLNFCLFFAL
jgi:hypothetical protein